MRNFTCEVYGRLLPKLGVLGALCMFSVGLQASPLAYVYSTSNQFGTIDLSSGSFILIGTTVSGLNSLTTSPGGTIYSQDGSGTLFTINPSTGAATTVGTGGTPVGLADSPSGTLYGVTVSNLYTVNTSSGATTSVGAFGTTFLGDAAAVSPTGQLYVVGATNFNSTGLYSVNTATGAATLIGDDGFLVFTIFFSGNSLYGFTANSATGFSPGPIVSIDPTTGIATIVSTQDPALNTVLGATAFSGTTSTPEPATFAITGLAGLGLLMFRKRRA